MGTTRSIMFSGLLMLGSSLAARAQCQQEADLHFTSATQVLAGGDYMGAAALFEKSATAEKSCPQPRLGDLAMELYNAAACYTFVGKFDNAVTLYKETIELDRQLSLLDDMAKATRDLASILVDQGKARDALVQARMLNEEVAAGQVEHLQPLSLGLILHVSMLCNVYDNLESYASQGLKNTQQQGNDSAWTDNQAYFYSQLARFYASRTKIDSTVMFLEKARASYTTCKNTDALSETCMLLADVYSRTYQKDKARQNYAAALDIFLATGEVMNQASALSFIGTIDLEQGKAREAIKSYNAALELYTQADKIENQAALHVSLGNAQEASGNYNAAIEMFEKAIQLYIEASAPSSCGVAMNNLGNVYTRRGEFDKAITLFQQLLASGDIAANEQLQVQVLNNIGGVYMSWGQYDKAMEYYDKAYAIATRLADKRDLPLLLNNIGGVYQKNDESREALDKFMQAVDACRQTGNTSMVPGLMNNVGNMYLQRGETARALVVLQEALTVAQQRGDASTAATLSDNIGNVYMQREAFPEAETFIAQALKIRRGLNERPLIASSLNNLAVLHLAQEKVPAAIACLNESVQILEELRETASGDARRDFLASQVTAYQNLIVAYIKDNQTGKALHVSELSKSKSLAEQLAGAARYDIPTAAQVQSMVDQNTLVLGIATIDNPSVSTFTVTRDGGVRATVHPRDALSRMLLSDVKVRSLVVATLSPDEIARLKKYLAGEQLDQLLSREVFENSIKAYVSLLNSKVYADVVTSRSLAHLYYTFFIAPVEARLAGKRNLVVMPDGVLGLIPFETLIDDEGRYLVERFDISYIHSFSVLNAITSRAYSSNREPVLAMGVFDYKGLVPPGELFPGDISTIKSQIYSDIEEGKPLSAYYTMLGYTSLNDLHTGRAELSSIRQTFPSATLLPDSLVTEQ